MQQLNRPAGSRTTADGPAPPPCRLTAGDLVLHLQLRHALAVLEHLQEQSTELVCRTSTTSTCSWHHVPMSGSSTSSKAPSPNVQKPQRMTQKWREAP